MTVVSTEERGTDAPATSLVEVQHLGPHAAGWDALVAASSQPSPFLLSRWLEPHETIRGAAYVLVLDGDELVGGPAVVVDRVLGVRRIRMLGTSSLAPDHLDVVAAPDRQEQVVAALGGGSAEVTRAPSDLRAKHIEVWRDRSGLIRGYGRFERHSRGGRHRFGALPRAGGRGRRGQARLRLHLGRRHG